MPKIEPVNSPCYCINFRRAANTMTKVYDQAFAAIDLTANQFFLLVSISQLKSCNKSELAQYVRLDRTTIIRNLGVLLKKNLIEEVPGPTNKVIQLTESGVTAITEGVVIWKQLQNSVKQILGAENIPSLWQLFENIDSLESHALPNTDSNSGCDSAECP